MNGLIVSILLLIWPDFSGATVSKKIFVSTPANRSFAAIEDQRSLKSISTKDPQFEATTESGEVSYVTPREHPAGTIYGQHVETPAVGQE